jgi:transcriptional regulator with XRE-family HTH domain
VRGRPDDAFGTGRDPLSEAVGEALRRARQSRGLTLRGAAERSRGTFKASSLGAYERAERKISLERFCDLATLYSILPDRLIALALELLDPQGRQSVVLDLNRMSNIPSPERRLVAEFVHRIRDRRHDLLSDLITLRSSDLQTMALLAGLRPRALLARLQPAVRPPSTGPESVRSDGSGS